MTFKVGDKVIFIGRQSNSNHNQDWNYIRGRVYTIDGFNSNKLDLRSKENDWWMDTNAFILKSPCKASCCGGEKKETCPFFESSR